MSDEAFDEGLVPLPAPRSRTKWWLRVAVLATVTAGVVVGVRRWRRAHAPAPPQGLHVRRGDVVLKAQATGRIVPRQEVFVRPLVSGMLVELAAHPGDRVRRGDLLATVRILADPVALGDAQSQAELARVRLTRATRELARARAGSSRDLIAAQALAQADDDARLARAELDAAQARVQLIARGTATTGALRSNRVLAPIDGTVLAVPVNVGDYVSETGSFRDGTTVAVVADMTDLLFKGQIEEAYVGQLRLSMPVSVRVGALPGASLQGTLQWISPRASVESVTGAPPPPGVQALTASAAGVTRFELWASIARPPGEVRAGYSATAEVELARADHALLIEESAVRFADGKAYVLPCHGAEREVRVGVSDGVRIEVLDGLRDGECVRERVSP